MNILQQLSEHLQNGEAAQTAALTRQAIEQGISPQTIVDDGLIAGMNVVGQKFREHEIFLPDVLMAAKAMYAGLDLVKPLFLKEKMRTLGKVVIGTVEGDLHDIGKNLVGIMLQGAGFEVIDLGNDVSPNRFIDAAEKQGAHVIGMSALLTTTMPGMKAVIDLAKERGLHGKIKFIVGGAPLSHQYAAEIGADAYCWDGMSAVDAVKKIMNSDS